MNPNDMSERIMAQARDLQNAVSQAASQTAEQMKPLIAKSMENAQVLQQTLAEHAKQSASINQEYANRALGHISELMKIGAEALKANAEQTRQMVQTMMSASQKTVDSATTATKTSTKKTGD